MKTILYKKEIKEEVYVKVDVYTVDLFDVGERSGSVVARLVTKDGIEIDRKERFYKKGEEFEKFWFEYNSTQSVVDIVNEMFGIKSSDIKDPDFEVTEKEHRTKDKIEE